MNTVERARKSLQDAILGVHGLMSEALRQGDLPSLAVLTRLSESLAAALSSVGAAQAARSGVRAERTKEALTAGGGTPPTKAASAYPKFFVDGERLVRIAWSKRERTEYEHKMPLKAVFAIATELESIGAAKRKFEAESLGKVSAEGKEIPSYQVYLCLAFMKATGLIGQHGRGSYSAPSPHRLVEQTRAALTALPQK
jgi:predicted glutamine amidotransferase